MRRADRETLRFEAEFSNLFRRSLKQRLQSLAPTIDAVFLTRHVPPGGIVVPGEEEYRHLFAAWLGKVFDSGMAAGREFVRIRTTRRTDKFADPVPVDALTFLRNRISLQGNWNRQLDSAVTRVLVNALERGATIPDVMDALRNVFPSFTEERLATIARTEVMTAYNEGLLSWFTSAENQGFVVAVQHVSILDDRVTDICRSRDGKILMVDDPRLRTTFRLGAHFQCRSIWRPITKYEWRRMSDSEKRSALDWSTALPAQAGFGNMPTSVLPSRPVAPTISPQEAALVLKRATPEMLQDAAEALGITPEQVVHLLKVHAP